MKKKEIPISTTKKLFFRQYIHLLNPFIKLRDKEIDVLSELLFYNDEFKELPEEVRWKMIFHTDNKTKMRTDLKISAASLDNIISSLRKKKIIDTTNGSVNKGYLILPEPEFELVFKFKYER